MRRWRWLIGSGVALLAAAAVLGIVLLSSSSQSRHTRTLPAPGPESSTMAPPPPPSPHTEQLGANVNRLFNDRTYSAGQIDAQLQALRATGASLARSDALWEATEPAAPRAGVHHFDWSFDDTIAQALAAHGLRWLPILDYTANWARAQPQLLHSAPRSAAEFAAFAAALAARYGPGGSFWRGHPSLTALPVQTYEVWNEPDNAEFWAPAPSPAGYADLYLATRRAVLGTDPGARVIIGGLTHPESFLPQMLQARPALRRLVDGVGIHPYGANPLVVLTRVRQARAVLASVGLSGVPLYVTEFGWTIHPQGALSWAPERLRPGYIEATIAALGHTNCGLAATLLYTWVTPERNPADKEDWYGIHPPEGGSSADTQAFAGGLHRAAAPARELHICPGD